MRCYQETLRSAQGHGSVTATGCSVTHGAHLCRSQLSWACSLQQLTGCPRAHCDVIRAALLSTFPTRMDYA